DKKVDLGALREDVQGVEENGDDYKEVPLGKYEVRVEKMELGETGEKSKNPGSPMLKVQFRIIAGESTKSCIFMNQVVTAAFGIHKANDFLRSLDSGIEVGFESYAQYADLILDIGEEIDGKLEYAIEYGQNKQGFSTFEVMEVFEV
ncbi:MAG: hypothetical protein RR842_11065, partial [Gordonibacter sp.]|uniref:DUF669 domain-containing protein n=1 Tax=Gordonibacter sp. TaxID=1968902 RepID=UPI002FC5F67D